MLFLVGLAIIAALIFLFILFGKGKPGIFTVSVPRISFTDTEKKTVWNTWQEIEQLITLGKPSQVKEAVIKADNLVDFGLKKMYPRLSNQNMGERLKVAKERFSEQNLYNDLWYAHKVRNSLVHDLEFHLPVFEGQNIIKKYQAVLEKFNLLEK